VLSPIAGKSRVDSLPKAKKISFIENYIKKRSFVPGVGTYFSDKQRKK
jgi:hypothetical protein